MLSHFKASSSTGPSQRKALIIAEKGAIRGDALRELVINGITALEEMTKHTRQQSEQLVLFQAYSALLDEHQAIILDGDQANHSRNRKEEELGNDPVLFKADPEWIELDRAVKELRDLELEKAKLTAEPSPELLKALLDFYENTGLDILVYHGADLTGYGTTDPELLKKVDALADGTVYQQMVIGGGHGTTEVLSGLKKDFVQDLILALQKKTISTNLICLGSCEGAAHSVYMHVLLQPNGMVLGYLGDCTNNFILATVNYQLGLTDEFISYKNLVESNEANTKDSSLALLQNSTVTGFELAKVARANPENLKYWQHTFAEIYGAYYMSLDFPPKIPPCRITDITLFGNGDIGLILDSFSKHGMAEGITFPSPQSDDTSTSADITSPTPIDTDMQPTATLTPVPHIDKHLLIKFQLLAIMGSLPSEADPLDDEFAEELDAIIEQHTHGNTREEVLASLSAQLPNVSICHFSEDTRSRLIAVNHAIANIVPPHGGDAPDPALMTAPITPAIATQSLRLDPEDFKNEIGKDPIKIGIKSGAY